MTLTVAYILGAVLFFHSLDSAPMVLVMDGEFGSAVTMLFVMDAEFEFVIDARDRFSCLQLIVVFSNPCRVKPYY